MKKIYKIIFLTIMIFFINVVISYAATWKDYDLEDYKNASPSNAGMLQGYLDAVGVKSLSKEDLEKYINCVDAFVSSEGGRFLDVGLIGTIKTKGEEANVRLKQIEDGKTDNDDSNVDIYDKIWKNYVKKQDKVEKASTKEDGKKFYEMLVNPNPPIDKMSNDLAEQYIILINKLLKSPGFSQYEQENPSARKELTEKVREARKAYDIKNDEALDALDDLGADVDAGGNAGGNIEKNIYRRPKILDKTAASSLDDMITDANDFVKGGAIQYEEEALQNFSSTLFNIFSIVGAAVAVIVGIVIGIKYMIGSVEEKAEYKKMLVPYIVGCVVVFGAFGIWKLIIVMLEGI